MPKEIEPFRLWWRSLTKDERLRHLRTHLGGLTDEYTDEDALAMYNKQHPVVKTPQLPDDYWKQRCLAAETYMAHRFMDPGSDNTKQAFFSWNNLAKAQSNE